ncbi:putative inactive lipase [Gluconacetobacter sp. SXCC-1]|uniref:lipase family protein n=1 Tax=Komagataeibacter rhaeticus TaxID=215221 RepID=UPI000207F863|nr:lipase family protein [Komagataeibacter rhaeticus]ATU72778.1 lipase [Komagataeibacter xylinus]EGG76511.1 putative inactive lipase [Gluconacetobacter sp. SXCC-1]WPP22551.1 lipase family protein [Komagataeibacter rhaeticus]
MSDPRSFLVSLLACCATAMGTSALAAAPATPLPPAGSPYGDGGVSAFYETDGVTLPAPGTMIRTEELNTPHLPDGTARAIRTLYSATDGMAEGTPVAVSGQILLPPGKVPRHGWPIIAWEHGTTGVADVCAPSWRGYSSRDRAYLAHWLAAGFAIVATDYQGLGTKGPHPYLLYRPEGYSVLAGLQAALKQFPTLLRNRIMLVGQSQGSGAALGAAWLAPAHAPELDILGVVATGVVADFHVPANAAHNPIPAVYTDPTQMDSAFAMLRVEGTDQSLNPTRDASTVLTSTGRDYARQARMSCLHSLFDYAAKKHISSPALFNAKLADYEKDHDAAFQIPDGHISMPVFVGTGLADGEAGTAGQYNAVAAMCDAGTTVSWHEYAGLTHNGAVNVSVRDSLPFVKRLMKGKHIASTCATLALPGPIQQATPGIPWNN